MAPDSRSAGGAARITLETAVTPRVRAKSEAPIFVTFLARTAKRNKIIDGDCVCHKNTSYSQINSLVKAVKDET
jgi:hypothetical protein